MVNILKQKILHADIGDGTSEYIFSKGLNPVPDACWGEKEELVMQ